MKPQKYKGTGDAVSVRNFLVDAESYIRHATKCQGLNDQERKYYFSRCLTGKAYEWSCRVDRKSLSYDKFLKLFKHKFYGPEQIMPVLIELRHCVQDESLKSYNYEFDLLADAIPDSWLSPQAKLSFYLDGLEESLQEALEEETVEDLETAMELSVQILCSYRESGGYWQL